MSARSYTLISGVLVSYGSGEKKYTLSEKSYARMYLDSKMKGKQITNSILKDELPYWCWNLIDSYYEKEIYNDEQFKTRRNVCGFDVIELCDYYLTFYRRKIRINPENFPNFMYVPLGIKQIVLLQDLQFKDNQIPHSAQALVDIDGPVEIDCIIEMFREMGFAIPPKSK